MCPVGEDYARLLEDALHVIPEDTPDKQARLTAMVDAESNQNMPAEFTANRRWIGPVDDK